MPNHCTITESNCLSNYTLKYHVVKLIAKAANEAACITLGMGCRQPTELWAVVTAPLAPAKPALAGQAVLVCESAHPPTVTPSLQSARHYSWHVSIRRLLGTVQQKAAVAAGPMQSWFRWKHQWDHFLSGEGAVRPTPGGHLRRGGWPGSIVLNRGWLPA